MPPVRLKDIAKRAGVSVMTVSKVLRDEPDVSAATKVRIRALAQEMGYVPDALAQSLRTRSTRLIGIIIPAITNPVYARLLLAAENWVHEAGYDLLLGHTLNEVDREEALIRRMIARRVSGLLVFPVHRMDAASKAYDELRRRRVPTVILGPPPSPYADFPSIQVEDVEGSAQATRHLIELGHRDIAYFVGPRAAVWAQERYEGYRKALRAGSVPSNERLVFQAGGTIEEGSKAALQMLKEGVCATAVQTVNDLVAIGAADTLISHGVRIPDDVSVVGFGNVLTSSFFRVPLTTVRQPKRSMGVAAMEMLHALIQGQHPESRRLATELLVRESTAPPPTVSRVGSTAIQPVPPETPASNLE